jgi:lysozyme family protein
VAANNRDVAIGITLGYEGGYTNHPSDPGGPTNWGITIHDARMYWLPNATADDVKRMPKSVAIEIYRQKYWAKMHCDERPAGVDLVDFDTGVNSGVGRTEQFRKRLDPQNLSPVAYVKAQCAMRLSFLHALRTWSVFGGGWGKRVANVEAKGVRMALGAEGKPLAPSLNKEAKAAAKKSAGHVGGATGTVAAPASQLPDPSSFDTTTKVGLCILGVVVALGVAYFVWHAVQNYHRSQAYKEAAQ